MQNNRSQAEEILRLTAAAGWTIVASAQVQAPRPAQTFNRIANALLGTRPKRWLAGGTVILGSVFLVAALIHQASPTEPAEAQTTNNAAPAKQIFGTGPAYVPPEQRKSSVPAQTSTPRPVATKKEAVTPNPLAAIGGSNYRLIQTSSEQWGLHPDLMPRLFGKESGFKKYAISDEGAAGMCQFTQQTFFGNVVNYGENLGLHEEIKHIKRGNRGYYANEWQDRILNLRYNLKYAIPLCAAHIRNDLNQLQSEIKRPLNFTDSSLSHFTGAAVARTLLLMKDDRKYRDKYAYKYVEPINMQGRTNRSIFFRNPDFSNDLRHYTPENEKFTKPYTVAEVYENKRRIMGDTPALLSQATARPWYAPLKNALN